MSFHGYDPGDRNNWYQSPQLGLFPTSPTGYSGGYYCLPSSHPHVTQFPSHPSYRPLPSQFPFQQSYSPPPPPPPSHTIINGFVFPHQFPSTHTHPSPDSNPYPWIYPSISQSHSYDPSVTSVNSHFVSTKTMPTSPVYHSAPSIPTFQSPSVSTFVPQHQFTDPKPLPLHRKQFRGCRCQVVMGAKARVSKKTRNPDLLRDVGKYSRSKRYHRRGLWVIKAKNSDIFPRHNAKATVAIMEELHQLLVGQTTLITEPESASSPLKFGSLPAGSVALTAANGSSSMLSASSRGIQISEKPNFNLSPHEVILGLNKDFATALITRNHSEHTTTAVVTEELVLNVDQNIVGGVNGVEFSDIVDGEDDNEDKDGEDDIEDKDGEDDNEDKDDEGGNECMIFGSSAASKKFSHHSAAFSYNEDSQRVDGQIVTVEGNDDLMRNNKEGLLEKIRDMSWPENAKLVDKLTSDIEQEQPVDVHDGLTRELAFYTQALTRMRMAFEKLQLMGLPFLRPEDYYAEMVKSESQLGKVKSQFLVEMTTNLTQSSLSQVPIMNALCKEHRTAEATQLFMDISNSQPELDMNVLAKILLKSLDKEQVSSIVIMDSIVAALCGRCIDSIELHVKMDDVGISFLNWLLAFPNAKFKREAASIRHSLAFYIDDQMGLEISTLKHEPQTAKSTHESYCLQLEVNAKEVHGSALRRCLFDLVLPNAVVNVYGQWGYIDYAYQMFKLVECKDVGSWMSTISCYVHYGLASEAFELCRLMKEINVEPDYFNACGMHDHGKEAIDLFKRMEDQKIASDHIMFLAQVFHIKGQMETDHRLANHWEKIWLLIAIAIIQWHLNGATELILSNGMRVCYNSTNFLDEQFIFTGFSFGGLSKLVASEYFYCLKGPTIAGEMGVYGYRSPVLLNMLAGKRAEVSTNLGAYTRTFNYNANNTSQTEFTGWLYVSLRYCFLSAIAMVTTFLLSVALALCVTALCVMMTIEKAHIAEFAEKAKKKLFLTILLQYGIPEVGEEFVSDIFCMQFAGLGKKTCRLGHGEVHNFCSLSDDTHTLSSLIINKASAFLLLRVTQIVQINRAANIGLEVCTGLRVINFNNDMIHSQPLIMPLLVIPAIVFIFEDQYCWNVDSSMTEHESVFLDKGAVENVHKWGWYKLRIVANAIMGVNYFFQAATLKEFRQEDVGNGIPLVCAPSIQDNEENGGLIVNNGCESWCCFT